MSFDFRMPNITGTDKEQLAQLRSYLYQFIPQLQWALNSIETSGGSGYVVQQQPRNVVSNSSTFDAVAAFPDLKALIIKSADIIEAYYDKINAKLQGEYLAISDFGIFTESTQQSIDANSMGITQAFSNTQKIYTDLDLAIQNANGEMESLKEDTEKNIGNVKTLVVESLANIRSGILYYNKGIPVYGLEIGQINLVDGDEKFNKYARFTSDRLSFYDQNDTEVAYVSNDKLYISKVEITANADAIVPAYKIGGYADFVTADGGIVTKWVGGV